MMEALQLEQVQDLNTADLSACESVIERGLQSFIDVGQALLRIREGRLYKASHRSFDDYCRTRWGLSRAHADRQIEASAIAETLTPVGVIPSERVAREIGKIDDSERETVWRAALKIEPDGPTVKTIREIHEQHLRDQLTSQAQDSLGDRPANIAQLKKILEAGREAEPRKRAIAEKQLVSKLFGGLDEEPSDGPAEESEAENHLGPDPVSERRPVEHGPESVDATEDELRDEADDDTDDERSPPMEAFRSAWGEMTEQEQDGFLAEVGAVRYSTLDGLRLQREDDEGFRVSKGIIPSGGRGGPMLSAMVNGGDVALARLGIHWLVTIDQAKKAYRAASLRCHPDHGGNAADFRRITEAWETVRPFFEATES